MADWLREHGVAIVVLAGYMHLLTPPSSTASRRRRERAPVAAPAFPGAHAVEEQLAAGVAESGATVHLVDEGIDSGPILAQERVPVAPATRRRRSTPASRRSSTACCRDVVGELCAR